MDHLVMCTPKESHGFPPYSHITTNDMISDTVTLENDTRLCRDRDGKWRARETLKSKFPLFRFHILNLSYLTNYFSSFIADNLTWATRQATTTRNNMAGYNEWHGTVTAGYDDSEQHGTWDKQQTNDSDTTLVGWWKCPRHVVWRVLGIIGMFLQFSFLFINTNTGTSI
jgi:hypothetical protein